MILRDIVSTCTSFVSHIFLYMSASGCACIVAKVSGMIYVKEEETPPVLEWKAIDQLKIITIPLRTLKKLQAPKETSPKMMLRILYQNPGEPEEKDLRLSFTNRPSMNDVKESLQTIISRQKTFVHDSPTPQPADSSGRSTPLGQPVDLMDFSTPAALTDSSLLKNYQLQQKLLLEDKNLRNIFTQSVIKYKLSPNIFWSTRINQLRTFALTISQHRGPYNVLSTIKPIATSDNQVNVNVTRDTINEIFDTYPVVRRAYSELVPAKFSEGEFWSRFFNSKLFRRLRGEKINTTNTRGDVVLDKYLYIDFNYVDSENGTATVEEERPVNKFLDLAGNEEDNSQKLGNKPDVTMRFVDENSKLEDRDSKKSSGQENEMMILMKNMNKLSSKIVSMNSILKETKTSINSTNSRPDDLSASELNEYQEELDLHDLNEAEELKYVKLNLNTEIQYERNVLDGEGKNITASSADLKSFLSENVFNTEIDLSDTYKSKEKEIEKSANEITNITKSNYRNYRLSNFKDNEGGENVLSENVYQELITFNITIMEFLSHFWKIYLNGDNPGQLKKIFTSLKNCKNSLTELIDNITQIFDKHELIQKNEKLKDKLVKDLNTCVYCLQAGLDKAITDYVKAVRSENDINENGKRPLPV